MFSSHHFDKHVVKIGLYFNGKNSKILLVVFIFLLDCIEHSLSNSKYPEHPVRILLRADYILRHHTTQS